MDEFGFDDSMFDSFDVDAAVANHQQKAPPKAHTTPAPPADKKMFTHSQPTGPSPDVVRTASGNNSLGFKTSTGSAEVQKTLFDSFGYSAFRDGQGEVVQSALSGKDSAVFWATGDGKSLCYQLPALHSNNITIVVSPLISLMQDQVQKLNNTVGQGSREIAAFLGSAQHDPHMESRVLRGEILVVYVTPEKLVGAGFLSQLAQLNSSRSGRKIGLLAIDEAHCVSQWGHDFRPEYARMGEFRETLPSVPIMVLTATAVKKVQTDIIDSLRLRDPHISLHTFDRPNFTINVQGANGNMSKMLGPLVERLKQRPESTIVYAPTTSLVEELCQWLSNKVHGSGVNVLMYHGSLPHDKREHAHLSFLNGKTHVIVATIAFGMGIDKPDIRRVVHYHAPKTIEEYYQQIGRAGRDGQPATCDMFFFSGDATRYMSDFYLGKLNAANRAAMVTSIECMRKYSEDACNCRRRLLLEYFDELPSFSRCGKCDCCVRSVKFADDQERDFSGEAHIVLLAAGASSGGMSMTHLTATMAGKSTTGNKWVKPAKLNELKSMRAALNLKPMGKLSRFTRTEEFFKELVPALVRSGHLGRTKMTSAARTPGGYSNTYEVYVMTAAGRTALSALNQKRGDWTVRLPVPAVVRKLEEAAAQKTKELREELRAGGVDVESIPEEELAAGKGEVLSAEKNWLQKLKYLHEKNPAKAARFEDLLKRIMDWRDAAAQRLGMAPGAVLQPHVAKQLAYTQPKEVKTLRAVGVRIAGVEQLAAMH
jgi:ATP-dependent DNA helicase RecQ/Werner syndrome ATP-dependent helicase